MTTLAFCSLCQSDIPLQSIIQDGDKAFCCSGCQMVFNILSALPESPGDIRAHPLFQQALKTGLISNPALLKEYQAFQLEIPAEECRRLYLEIRNMWCPSCAELIALLLKRQSGVLSCVIDYTTDLACIEYSPRHCDKDGLFQAIQQFGYEPVILEQAHERAVSRSLMLRFVISSFFSLNVMMFTYPLYATHYEGDAEGYGYLFAWLSLVCSVPIITYCLWPILRRFILALRTGIVGMETLVILGVSTAFGLSLYKMWQGDTYVYFDSMTVLVTLMLLGKIMETRAKFSAKEALMQLSKAVPSKGRRCQSDGKHVFVPLKEVAIGETLLAICGEKIVLDGQVTEGSGSCNEALLTGEALPVSKAKGSCVLAGSIVQQGQLYYQVTATSEQSTLQQIVHLVERELLHKAPYKRPADAIVRWFVPIILLLAGFTALITYWSGESLSEAGLRAVSILLISCPCALGIAAPIAEAHLLNTLAAQGIFIRNRGVLKFLGKETIYLFDKTGTVTEGKFTLLQGLEQLSLEQRSILKAMTRVSSHPLSSTISLALQEDPTPLDTFEEIPGRGLRAILAERHYLLGSEHLLKSFGVPLPTTSRLEKEPSLVTHLFFTEEQQVFELLLEDTIRPEISTLIDALAPARCYLLSGDHENTVAAVARQCGFTRWISDCSPLDKQHFAKQWRQQGEIVAMIGDGINDAPALAEAHVGISVLSATDLSIQASDILMTTAHLQRLGLIRSLAVKCRRIISQNLFWAFFYNGIGIGLAMAGLLSPLFATFAMVASSLIVMFNAQRLK